MKVSVNKKSGFSLVELSIVIVIVGLISAGMVAGGQIVESAKVQAQISQLYEYKHAYDSFKEQFNAIPGDFNKAENYWPGSTNGNGDQKITNNADDFNFSARFNDPWFESFRFFEHLSYSGLVDRKFSDNWALNVGYPELALSKGRGMAAAGRIQDRGGNLQLSDAARTKQYTAFLALNISKPNETSRSLYNDKMGTSSPKFYRSIDIKIDDGHANDGFFGAYTSNITDWADIPGDPYDPQYERNCLDSIDGDYMPANKALVCHGFFILEK